LRRFLRAQKQTWREDATNRNTKRMRARIRKKLLPLLEKQFQPAIVKHLATLAELGETTKHFWRPSRKNGPVCWFKTKMSGRESAWTICSQRTREEHSTRRSPRSRGQQEH